MPQLTAADLFSPMPSGVGPYGNVPLNPPAGTWLAFLLNTATQVQLPTTSWQPGAPERTIFAIESVGFQQSDVNISIFSQGSFLQSAASGTVSYVTVGGLAVTVPVTPDPSNTAQNPSGQLGYLDLLTQNVFNTYRLQSQAATGPLAIVNTKTGSVGPYSPGTYHVGNASTGATYSNPSSITIPSSIIAGSGGTVAGVLGGLAFSIIQTLTAHGLSQGQSVYLAIPLSSGITGLNGVFAIVTATTATSFQVSISSSGTWVTGGQVYACTVATMVCDVAGVVGSAAPGTVITTITQNTGVFCSNPSGWSGNNWETNQALASRAQLSLAIASPNGPSQSYVYYALSAVQFLSELSPPYVLTNGPVAATEFAVPATGQIQVVVGSATPASTLLGQPVTPGCAQLPISSVSNANPCVVTCALPTGLLPSESFTVTISGVLGTAGVNGTFTGTYVSSTAFSIPINTSVSGIYTGGGSIEGGDLGFIDQLIQTNVTPNGQTEVTLSALALPIAIVATVVVPQAYVSAYRLAVLTQLQTQIASYAMGGNAPDFEVAYDDIVGALEEAGVLVLGQASYVRQVQSLSLNGLGVGVGVPFPTNQYQALLAVPTLSVLGV